MPAASGCTTSKLRSSLWIFRVISRRCLRFIWCQLFGVGRQIAFLFFCDCLDFMAHLPWLIFHGGFNSARPGRRPLHSLSIGVGPLFFSDQRRYHLYNRQYRSHAPLSGRNAPESICGLAAESRCASDFNSHQAACHSSHTLFIRFLSHTTTPAGWPLLLSPGPWLVGTTKVYSGVGADIVMESITLKTGPCWGPSTKLTFSEIVKKPQ